MDTIGLNTLSVERIWFITGSSRGLGRSLMEAVLKHGDRVVATARKVDVFDELKATYGDRLLPLALDVTEPAQVAAVVGQAFDAFGRIDVVVNNAGYGFTGAFEEMTDEEFESQIDTNFWGVVHVTRAFIPRLRKQGSGHILQVTSIGGRGANPGLSGYQAAKFAAEGFSEAIAQELAPLGLKLTIVEPGGFNTDWAGSSMGYATPMPEYDATVGTFRRLIAAHADGALGDPDKAAQAILKLVDLPEAPLRLPLGNDALFLLRAGYQRSISELDRWHDLSASTDRDDLPPFDGPAMLKALGYA